jgi:hypothetical protein
MKLPTSSVNSATRFSGHSEWVVLSCEFSDFRGAAASRLLFSLVYAVLLKSLSVADPADLLRLGKTAQCCYIWSYAQDPEFGLVSYDLYTYLRDHTDFCCAAVAYASCVALLSAARLLLASTILLRPSGLIRLLGWLDFLLEGLDAVTLPSGACRLVLGAIGSDFAATSRLLLD